MSQCLQASLIAKYMDSLSVQKMRKACGCISIPLPATTCNFQHEGVISIRKTAMGLSETYQRKMDWFHMRVAICLKQKQTCCTERFTWFLKLADGSTLLEFLWISSVISSLSSSVFMVVFYCYLQAGSYNCYCAFPWPLLSYLTQLPKYCKLLYYTVDCYEE